MSGEEQEARVLAEDGSSGGSGGSSSPSPGDTLPWNLGKTQRSRRSGSGSGGNGSVLDPAERAVIRIAGEASAPYFCRQLTIELTPAARPVQVSALGVKGWPEVALWSGRTSPAPGECAPHSATCWPLLPSHTKQRPSFQPRAAMGGYFCGSLLGRCVAACRSRTQRPPGQQKPELAIVAVS